MIARKREGCGKRWLLSRNFLDFLELNLGSASRLRRPAALPRTQRPQTSKFKASSIKRLRLNNSNGIDIEYHCKPLGATDWNGSGMHANFSTTYLRDVGGKDYFEKFMAAFEEAREDVSGRLSGCHGIG